MLCVICSSGKNRPAVCPPLRPLSVSLTLLPLSSSPSLLSATRATAQHVVSPYISVCACLFVCLCLLHNSWIWFVLLNLAMGLIIAVKTHGRKTESVGTYILQLSDMENIRLSVNSHMFMICFYVIVLFTVVHT